MIIIMMTAVNMRSFWKSYSALNLFKREVQRKKSSLSKACRRVRGAQVKLHSFLTSALDESEWLISRPGRFLSRERTRYLLDKRLGGP